MNDAATAKPPTCAARGMAMTLRTGKSGRYRDCTGSTKAHQGETGCRGRTLPMEKLDTGSERFTRSKVLQLIRGQNSSATGRLPVPPEFSLLTQGVTE
jgi:hypothetical protein